MAGSAFEDPQVVETVRANFTPVLIDGDNDRATGERYGVDGFPTVVFTDAQGEALDTVEGYILPEEFRARAEQAASKLKLR